MKGLFKNYVKRSKTNGKPASILYAILLSNLVIFVNKEKFIIENPFIILFIYTPILLFILRETEVNDNLCYNIR